LLISRSGAASFASARAAQVGAFVSNPASTTEKSCGADRAAPVRMRDRR
jgi:hypothetical protein